MPVGIRKLMYILGGAVLLGVFVQFSIDKEDYNESVFSPNKQLPPFLTETSSWSDSVINTLSLEEKIGQMIMVAAYPNKGTEDIQRVAKLIKDYHVGGIIFFQGTTRQVAELTDYYQSISKTPLLIAIDGEWGLGMRLSDGLSYPKEMTLGAITDEMLIYEMGRDIARQLKHIGVHVNFAPVVDINNNAQNPVINSRSFGELRANVARKGILYMRGMQDEGVLAFAKHFPGHGDTKTDSHKGLPVIEYSPERLDSLELYPFRALINAGVGGVMIAHLNVLSLDTTRGLPSTLSPIIVDSLLQKKMGFKGLVVTDAMEMKGMADFYPGVEANLRAVLAGNDILLMPADVENTIPAIMQAIDSNIISRETIEISCRKIIKAKEWSLKNELNQKFDYDSLNNPQFVLTRQKLLEASLTVIKNDDNLLPFRKLDTLKIAHISIGAEKGLEFTERLNLFADIQHFDLTSEIDSCRLIEVFDSLSAYNLVIMSLHSNSIFAARNFDISLTKLQLIDTILYSFPTAFAAFINPYLLGQLTYLNNAKCIVEAYENDSVTQTAVAHLIFGAIGADGKLPVTINSEFIAGCGIPTQAIGRFKYVSPFEAGFDSKKLNRIDSIVNDAINEKAMPGCQVFAAINGKVFYEKSFGFHDYQKRLPVINNDLYDIASLTKITATLPVLIKLDSENKISTDESLSKYFPYLDTCDKGKIVISDILLHQAGLAAWIPFYWKTLEPVFPGEELITTKFSENYPIQIGTKSYLNKHVKYKDNFFTDTFSIQYPYHVANGMFMRKDLADSMWNDIINSEIDKPGKYRYSDLGFYILKKIIEQKSSQTLDKIAETTFYNSLGAYTLKFNPLLKFSKDNIVPTENDLVFRHQIVHGYVHDPGAAMLGGVSGHAGLFGCANDVGKIMQMYLDNGHYGGVDYLDSKFISKYTNCAACTNGNRRGLGFDKPSLDASQPGPTFNGISTKSFGHTGFTGTMAWADPETGIVFVFLSNRVYPDALNNKLVKMDVRTKVQEAIYSARIK